MDVRITSTAKRHKLSAARIRQALSGAVLDHVDGDMAIYHGTDLTGLALELGIVEDNKRPGLVVIHAMPLEWRKK